MRISDWSSEVCSSDLQADDFPAYVSIFLTGHIFAPLIIAIVKDADVFVGALVAIIVPVAMVLMINPLQPAKGALIAGQWWLGMHGFQTRRADQSTAEGRVGNEGVCACRSRWMPD